MNIENKALAFATAKHKGQFRKFSAREYINHPIEVADLLKTTLEVPDENLIAAAYCHDLVEDTDTSVREIELEFNTDIAKLVSGVSHSPFIVLNSIKGRKDKHKYNIAWYKSQSARAQTLKLADRVCNLREFLLYWDNLPSKEKFFVKDVYVEESRQLLLSIGHANINFSNMITNERLRILNK